MKKKSGFRGLIPPIWNKKCFRIMRLTILFLFVGFMQVSASLYSQNTKLSLDFRNTRVVDVLEAIENQSEFRFAYSAEYIDMNRKVSVDVKSQSIEKTMEILFGGTDVKYSINDRHIMLFPEGMSTNVSQQQKSVSGKVTDSSGTSLPGVSVVVKGTTNGTITDVNGNYSILNVPRDATLQFSFVGMKSQEIPVVGKSTISVTMVEEAIGLEEVVAVGYGTQKKVNLTGAVSSVKGDVLENRPIANIGQGLQGVIPNLQVTQSNYAPGQGASFNIRGYTSLNGGGGH